MVLLSLPETPETRGLFDAKRLSRMKEGAILLNAGRGNAIDTPALCDAVESGHLRGAGLDVTDPEPLPPDHRVWGVKDIVITPHVSEGSTCPIPMTGSFRSAWRICGGSWQEKSCFTG